MAICLFIGQTSLSRVDFSTCYHLLSLHTNSVSQKLKLDQSPSSQTSCCIPPDISWETWHSPPRNTVLNLETLIAHWFFKAVFNIRAQKNFISLTAKKKKDSRRITSLPTNFYFYCSQTGWCELGRGYLYSISSDELLDGGEQSSPSSRSVLFYFWMPPLGSGWAACQSGVRLLRRLTHSQPHCFSSHM